MAPRFVLAETTGWFNPSTGGTGGRKKMGVTVAVLDRRNCDHVVALFRTEECASINRIEVVRDRAAVVCADLNLRSEAA